MLQICCILHGSLSVAGLGMHMHICTWSHITIEHHSWAHHNWASQLNTSQLNITIEHHNWTSQLNITIEHITIEHITIEHHIWTHHNWTSQLNNTIEHITIEHHSWAHHSWNKNCCLGSHVGIIFLSVITDQWSPISHHRLVITGSVITSKWTQWSRDQWSLDQSSLDHWALSDHWSVISDHRIFHHWMSDHGSLRFWLWWWMWWGMREIWWCWWSWVAGWFVQGTITPSPIPTLEQVPWDSRGALWGASVRANCF